MYEITKHEFAKWQSLLQKGELTKYEKTLLSQINSKFDEIAAVGTARGGRSKLLGEKIRELKNQTVDEITSLVEKEVDQDKIERIESLEVENFRGFGAVQKFEFKSRYTFFHGPNGSGKTSFCEALEYSVLGMIEEATARNIPIEKYILHAGQKKVQKPRMICKYSSGKKEHVCQIIMSTGLDLLKKIGLRDFRILEQVLLRHKQRGLLHYLVFLNFKSL